MSNVRQILLRHIRQDGGTQARARMDQNALDDYAEAMAAGASFPAIIVFEDRENILWLGDGFHRVAAAEAAGKKNIKAEIRAGGLREARLFAIGANITHGVRRSNADKRLAVSLLLDDPEWGAWSNREIAQVAGVSHNLVNEMRSERVASDATQPPIQAPHTPTLDESDDDSQDDKITFGHGAGGFTPADGSDPTPIVICPEGCTIDHTPKAGPDTIASLERKIAQLEEDAEEKDAEIAELTRKLEEAGAQVQELLEENEAMHRILDAEDLMAEFKKEIASVAERARIAEARQRGMMVENADLAHRLKSALRRLEKKPAEVA